MQQKTYAFVYSEKVLYWIMEILKNWNLLTQFPKDTNYDTQDNRQGIGTLSYDIKWYLKVRDCLLTLSAKYFLATNHW